MADKYELVASKIAEIEAEMRRVGAWQSQPLPPSAYEFKKAFAMDTMVPEQWLQFVFLPRVRERLAERALPDGSQVGMYALRNFDGDDRMETLVGLLCEFDSLVRG